MKKVVAILMSAALGLVAAFYGFHGLELCISSAGHLALEHADGGDCCPSEGGDRGHSDGAESLKAPSDDCACCSCVDIPLVFSGLKDTRVSKTRTDTPVDSSAAAQPVVTTAANSFGPSGRSLASLFVEATAVEVAQTIVLRT